MNKIILIVLLIFTACSNKPTQKVVPIDEAKKDGFEVIIFKEDNFKIINYSEIQKNTSYNYLIPLDRIKTLSKNIEKENNLTRYFITTEVTQLSNTKQNICIKFHYSKSTYGYCYEATSKSITPLNSSYHDFSENKLTIYKD